MAHSGHRAGVPGTRQLTTVAGTSELAKATGRPWCWSLVAFLVLMGLPSLWARGHAQEPNQAGLVIQFGNGTVATYCVEFAEPEISGYDLLIRSGLPVQASISAGSGVFICGIGEVGCPESDCMCEYPPNYWSYWHYRGGEWAYSQMGISGSIVGPADLEGWAWGDGDPPPDIAFDQICAPPTETPTPTASWTSSPTLTPSHTPSATCTHTREPTSTPSPVPPTETPAPTVTAHAAALSAATFVTDAATTPPKVRLPAETATSRPPASGMSHATPTLRLATPTGAQTVELMTSTIQVPTANPSPSAAAVTSSATAAPSATTQAVVLVLPTPVTVGGQVAAGSAPEPPAGGRSRNLIALLSVGAGVAYLFFALFVIVLAALYVIVRMRTR